MTERIEPTQRETQQPKSREGDFVTRKIRNLARRVLRRPTKDEGLPEQAISPEGLVRAEKARNPERARRIGADGCVVRSLISALTHMTGIRNLKVEPEEWDARFQQLDHGVENNEQNDRNIEELYKAYAENNTPLGNAVNQVNIVLHKEESLATIKQRILAGEQVMVITGDYLHMFHAGLDKMNEKGNIISLSDQKKRSLLSQKKKFNEIDLSDGNHTTFSVTPKKTQGENVAKEITEQQSKFALAA